MSDCLDALRQLLTEKEVDGYLVTDPRSRRYLSGFTGSSGALYITEKAQWIATDFRYYEQAAQQCPDFTLWPQKGALSDAIGELLQAERPSRVAFEGDGMTVALYEAIRAAAPDGIEWRAQSGDIGTLRSVKRQDEIAAVRHAQAITDTAAAQLPYLIEPGKSERQIAWSLEQSMREMGADGTAFEVCVASGPNGAFPHHRPTDRVIETDEIVLVDFGARLHGYHSDTTRTFFTGEPPSDYRERYGIVLEALARAEAAVRPGANLRAVDGIARDYIAAQGYGDAFGHGLGHGVGLDIHEPPSISWRAAEGETLLAHQIVTVEPGIYLPGWGGIRIEDLVLVTPEGVEILTTASKAIDAWRMARD